MESIDHIGGSSRRGGFFFVRMALFLGIVAALAVLLTLSLWPKKAAQLSAMLNETSGISLSDIVNLRISGQDSQGRPYIITAHSAKPKTNSIFKGVMAESGELTGIEANLDMGDEENWVFLLSPAGEFDANRHHLRVGPGFNLYSSMGYQMRGRSASFDLKAGMVIVHGEVDGWGPIGEITAASLESRDMGSQIRFYGGVEVVLIPLKDKAKGHKQNVKK